MPKHPTRAKQIAFSAATLAGLGIAVVAPAGAAHAAGATSTPSSEVTGYVYVDDNTTGVNTIAGFARHADASLTPLSGSPFTAGGAGTGVSLASQGAIQFSSDGRYVIAADAGSNQLSVLRVEHDGSLKLVSGGVVDSGGSTPVSIAVHNQFVYVANAGSSDSTYSGFTLNPGGHLSPLGGSTVSLPSGSQPGDVTFNPTGTNLIGTRVGTSQIDSFRVDRDGLLTAAPDSPIAAQATGPFGSEFNPVSPRQLFVSNAHAGAGQGSVSSFGAGPDGTLSSLAAPASNGQSGTCWVEITPNGSVLFAVNTGSGTISSYNIGSDGSLRLAGNNPVSNQAGVGAVDARLDPTGKTLWVDESQANQLGGFAVDGTSLTQLPTTPLPAGAAAAGIVVS